MDSRRKPRGPSAESGWRLRARAKKQSEHAKATIPVVGSQAVTYAAETSKSEIKEIETLGRGKLSWSASPVAGSPSASTRHRAQVRQEHFSQTAELLATPASRVARLPAVSSCPDDFPNSVAVSLASRSQTALGTIGDRVSGLTKRSYGIH